MDSNLLIFIFSMVVNTVIALLIFEARFKSKGTNHGEKGVPGPSGKRGPRGLTGTRFDDNSFECAGFKNIVDDRKCTYHSYQATQTPSPTMGAD